MGTVGTSSLFHRDFEPSYLSDDSRVKSNRLSMTAIGKKDESKYVYAGDAGLAGHMTTLGWAMNSTRSISSTQYVKADTTERK
jgi:hypothetical protein